MALTVETGAIVTGANSYCLRADYILFAASFGITIANDDAADVELLKAAQFIDQHEANMKGDRVQRDQPMSFPRAGVVIDNWSWSSAEIPRQVRLCQMQFALDIHDGFDPWNPAVNPNLVKKRTRVEGAVDVTYAVSDNAAQKLSRTSKADALLNSLLNRSGLFSVPLVRS